jgi:hypothetical protein
MDVALRQRLDGVARISISQSMQTADVNFASAPHRFSATAFREAVGEAEVEVLRFEIDVCGDVVLEQGRPWLTAGSDRFLLTDAGPAPGQFVCVTGGLDDVSGRPHLALASVRVIP